MPPRRNFHLNSGTVAMDRLRKYVARGGFVYQNFYINVVYEMARFHRLHSSFVVILLTLLLPDYKICTSFGYYLLSATFGYSALFYHPTTSYSIVLLSAY